jgi:hypothetical protein
MRLEEKVPYFPNATILEDVSRDYRRRDENELLTLVDTHVFGTICMTLRESEGNRRTTQALGLTRECMMALENQMIDRSVVSPSGD